MKFPDIPQFLDHNVVAFWESWILRHLRGFRAFQLVEMLLHFSKPHRALPLEPSRAANICKTQICTRRSCNARRNPARDRCRLRFSAVDREQKSWARPSRTTTAALSVSDLFTKRTSTRVVSRDHNGVCRKGEELYGDACEDSPIKHCLMTSCEIYGSRERSPSRAKFANAPRRSLCTIYD